MLFYSLLLGSLASSLQKNLSKEDVSYVFEGSLPPVG